MYAYFVYAVNLQNFTFFRENLCDKFFSNILHLMPLTTILLFSDVLLCSHKMYPRANSWAPARADPSCFLQDLENAYHGQPSLTVVGKESAKKKESQVDMLSCGVQSEQRGHGLCPLGDAGLCAEADTGHSL